MMVVFVQLEKAGWKKGTDLGRRRRGEQLRVW